LPNLPPELGGGPITTLTRGVRWATLAMTFEPKPTLRAVVQAKDADTAKSLQALTQNAWKLLVERTEANPELADLAKALGQMTPAAQGDRVTLEADLQASAALVAVPVRKAREAARRSQCVNNLKQIALAMHNFHATHNSFPPAYSVSEDGKPLLSWRVHILPFLEQKALYDQFKLDEPWDSPHNKALISRLPSTYICPSASGKLAAEGKTSYLTPRGANTIFPGANAVRLQEITDGTSNTILVIDANDEAAVPWTKPDDWEVPAPFTTKGLFGHHVRGTNFAFADGSVKFLKDTIAPITLQALLTRNGGEVLRAEDF
jgi:prepilin-type processing-associated H-X9-DG protein